MSWSFVDSLSPDELARYSRHLLLEELGREGQLRLKASRMLVIGAGGLGSPAALYLAAAGVGTIGIADFDRVERHNLQRQLLHTDATVGQPKVRSAADQLARTNPHIRIHEHPLAVSEANALELFSLYDVIIDGTDTFSVRYLNNDAAVLTQRPLVHGSIYKFEGSVAVFAPQRGGPCYRCLFPEPPAPGSVPNCGEAGVLGALCGVIGSLQALEAIKLCTGLGQPLIGRLLTFDALNASFRTLKVPRDPHCPVCGQAPSIRSLQASRYLPTCEKPVPSQSPLPMPDAPSPPLEISVQQAADWLRTRSDQVVIIDVREPYETEICSVSGTRSIPMQQIPAQLGSLPKDRHLLILCHLGGRSMRVTEFLRKSGFPQVSNIAGGIEAWAMEVDPSLRRY